MSAEVCQYQDKPIVIITLHEPYNPTQLKPLSPSQAENLLQHHGTIHRIVDSSQINESYTEFATAIACVGRSMSLDITKSRFQTHFVVGDSVRINVDDSQLQLYTTLDEALQAVQATI